MHAYSRYERIRLLTVPAYAQMYASVENNTNKYVRRAVRVFQVAEIYNVSTRLAVAVWAYTVRQLHFFQHLDISFL